MALKMPPTNPHRKSTHAFQFTESPSLSEGRSIFQRTPSSQLGMERNTLRPMSRLSQKSEHANAAQVDTKNILEYAGSSLGATLLSGRGKGSWSGL